MNLQRISFSIILFFISISCTDPVTPEFEFREGLIFIEGFASTSPGASFVTINESAIEFGVYVVNFVEGAQVNFENVDTAEIVLLEEVKGAYQAPSDFAVSAGEQWKLNVLAQNGKRYESRPEVVLQPVPINNLEANYDPELTFDVGRNVFVPGHSARVSFSDPADTENFYYWRYRTYENLEQCELCIRGYFRNGECQNFPNVEAGLPFLNYTCDTDCWRIRFPISIAIFEDEFSNGKTTNDLEIGNLLLYTKEDMVIVLEQISLTASAYEYYKVLKDIIDNSSGLNAPPPAALVGNLFNPNDSEDFVFGRFTTSGSSTAYLFIDRTDITEDALEVIGETRYEMFGDPVPPPISGTAPCEESRFRTAIIPPGWIEN